MRKNRRAHRAVQTPQTVNRNLGWKRSSPCTSNLGTLFVSFVFLNGLFARPGDALRPRDLGTLFVSFVFLNGLFAPSRGPGLVARRARPRNLGTQPGDALRQLRLFEPQPGDALRQLRLFERPFRSEPKTQRAKDAASQRTSSEDSPEQQRAKGHPAKIHPSSGKLPLPGPSLPAVTASQRTSSEDSPEQRKVTASQRTSSEDSPEQRKVAPTARDRACPRSRIFGPRGADRQPRHFAPRRAHRSFGSFRGSGGKGRRDRTFDRQAAAR